ncbi:type II secretion system F family protein [Pseudomonas sp. Hp2]|uniref:type II secretion system F family protein n=1 Tax=Pseudomonas sp. Hp2 TaxID=701189 RepID=UPI00112D81B0|nr:type II secretion system F family protein [Pseudomonas sp. Hp2]
MNLLASAVFLFALALLLFAIDLLLRGRRAEQAERALQQALQGQREQAQADSASRTPVQRLLDKVTLLGQRLEGSRLHAWLLAPEDRLLLEQVGWNTRNGTAAFLGLRLLLALLLPILALLVLQPKGNHVPILIVAALAIGVLLPKIVLRNWAARLRKRASDELPLLIDLLRLLQGVGFSVDQSLQMLGDKLRDALPLLGGELNEANTAYTRGRSRAQSLRRIGESFGNEDLHSLVQMLVQVHQHGGAMQEPLRQFGMRLREQRRMQLKEKVGKLSVKMTMVMMLTLLPALMLVLGGPALLALVRAVARMGS